MNLVSSSQNFEDVMLWRSLKNVGNGFYVDVGAAWPDTDSVTKLFYDQGWSGINIEPNPDFYARLCEQRPRDINLRIAVCDRDGERNLNLFSDTGLSTLDQVVAKEHVKNNFECMSIRVTTATLSSLFQRYLPKQQEIHFLKIDIEGLEAEVLASNDWSLYRPWIVVVESTLPMSQVECHHTWEPQLLAASYTFAYADGLNRFYIENAHLDLLVYFKYPPNVFDQFTLASQVGAEARADELSSVIQTVQASLVAAEARVVALSNELTSMLESRSWKVTKPLRHSSLYAGRLKGFIKQIVHTQPRVLFMRCINRMRALIEQQPALKKFFLIVLNKFPRIKLLLRGQATSIARTSTQTGVNPEIYSSPTYIRKEKIVSQVLDGLGPKK
jgi:FkbM family methyltransferase